MAPLARTADFSVGGGGQAERALEDHGEVALVGETRRQRDLGERGLRSGEFLTCIVDAESANVLARCASEMTTEGASQMRLVDAYGSSEFMQ